MGLPRIIELQYHDFLRILQQATDAKKRIDKSDKARWGEFVRKNKVPEAGMAVKAEAGAMSGKTKAVIIEGAGTSDGYYVYSADDMFCLKYEFDGGD